MRARKDGRFDRVSDLLKSATGNRMGPQLLNGLCRIQRSGYSLVYFPFEESRKVWLAEASRRAVD